MVSERVKEQGELSRQVSAQIRAERAAAGLSRVQLVELSGVPLSTLRKLEDGRGVADVMQLGRICGALNLPIVEFWERVMHRMHLVARGEDRISDD